MRHHARLQLHLRGSGGRNVAVRTNYLPLRAALLSFQVHRGSSPGINGSQAPCIPSARRKLLLVCGEPNVTADSTRNTVGLSERIKCLLEAAPVEGVVPIDEVQRKEQCINFLFSPTWSLLRQFQFPQSSFPTRGRQSNL